MSKIHNIIKDIFIDPKDSLLRPNEHKKIFYSEFTKKYYDTEEEAIKDNVKYMEEFYGKSHKK